MTDRFGNAAAAGIAYFGVVFAIGFVLGTVRVVVLVPQIGEISATIIELPAMLALSWFACSWAVNRFAVPPRWSERLLMGILSFGLLMLGELSVSVFGFGRTVPQHLANYLKPLPALGLTAQALFAVFPLLQSLRHRNRWQGGLRSLLERRD